MSAEVTAETVWMEALADQAVREAVAVTAKAVEVVMEALAVQQGLEVPQATFAFRTGQPHLNLLPQAPDRGLRQTYKEAARERRATGGQGVPVAAVPETAACGHTGVVEKVRTV